MNKFKLICCLLLITIFTTGVTSTACSNSSVTGQSSTNNDVIDHCPFSLNTQEVGLTTAIDGTIFVRGNSEDPNDRRIQITARVEIDEADWGGISFNIDRGWKVESIVSDYPRGNPEPEQYTILFQTASEDMEFGTLIETGNTRHGAPDSSGGNGTLIIEIVPGSPDEQLPETFQVVIGAGSKGDTITSPVHETFSVSMNGN